MTMNTNAQLDFEYPAHIYPHLMYICICENPTLALAVRPANAICNVCTICIYSCEP